MFFITNLSECRFRLRRDLCRKHPADHDRTLRAAELAADGGPNGVDELLQSRVSDAAPRDVRAIIDDLHDHSPKTRTIGG
jgi:hypothetical protein